MKIRDVLSYALYNLHILKNPTYLQTLHNVIFQEKHGC